MVISSYNLDEIINRLLYLYYLYEFYVWTHPDTKINIFTDNEIISLSLYNNSDIIDEVIINFSPEEVNLRHYIFLSLFASILGKREIKEDGNTFFNKAHLSYLDMIVIDEDLLQIIKNLVSNQYNEIIDINKEELRSINKSLYQKDIKKLLKKIDRRIDLSKKILGVD